MKKRIFIISSIILFIDIISKRLVINLMIEDESIKIIKNFFSLTYAKNEGVAFSLMDGYVPLIIISTILVLFMIFKYIKDNAISRSDIIGYSFVIGGAIGNLVDRVVYGYVVDFLDFNIFGYNYPIFNLADTFIVIGVIILLVFGRSGSNEVSS